MMTKRAQMQVEELLKTCPYEWTIDETDTMFHFFGGKFKVSPETFEFFWMEHKLHPSFLLEKTEKHLESLEAGEEIDFILSGDRYMQPFVLLELKLIAKPWNAGRSSVHLWRILSQELYELPSDPADIASW